MPKHSAIQVTEGVHKELSHEVAGLAVEHHFLSEKALHFRNTWDKQESARDDVPPQTPNSEFAFEDTFQSLPTPFPDLTDLEVPYVREKGVRSCIEVLGKYFGCKDYKVNLLQFWFLDIITDCLWRSQDDFRLPVDLQKTVLAWVLHFLDILRDPHQNISRKKFFTIFKEAILVAAEIVDEGCDTIPLPEKVFSLIQEDEGSDSGSSSDIASSSSSIKITPADYDNVSCIELEVDGKDRIYELPKETCTCNKYDLSSVDTLTETESHGEEVEAEMHGKEEAEVGEEGEAEQLEDIEFYQADPNIPLRFLPLAEVEEEEEEDETVLEESVPSRSICIISDVIKELAGVDSQTEDPYEIHEIAEKFCVTLASAASSQTADTVSDHSVLEKRKTLSKENSETEKSKRKSLIKEEVLKNLANQKLWEQRLLDMDNPKKGWIPATSPMDLSQEQTEEEIVEDEESVDNGAEDDDEWVDIVLKKRKKEINVEEDIQVVNFGVLWAITDFIFKYFYESFQFTVIKLAFQATPDIITQKVNTEWKIPKKIKEQLQKPKEEKPKKEKPKKEKKEKPKKDKKGKDKKDKKADKKGKGSKDKKPKKEKPVKLTKEEKAELDRQRKEQEKLEEELWKLEENKRFMFPLTDAATDDLFNSIFDNWVKVDLTKKAKGKGKEKGKGKGKK